MNHPSHDPEDSAGVIAPPPLIFGVALIGGLLLGRGAMVGTRAACARVSGALAIAGGASLGVSALAILKRNGTNARPDLATTTVVMDGPFGYTRNPAYVGAASIYIGVALFAQSLPALAFLPIALVVVERGVVEREERYLARKFGEPYRSYCERVPRWF